MEKKSIVLLIVSSIILIIAIIFAVWSFNLDLNDSKLSNTNTENIHFEKNPIENQIMDKHQNENIRNEIPEEITETKDFSAVYTDFTISKENNDTFKLSDHKDEPVVILFHTNENENSKKMLEKLNNQYLNYKDEINFVVIQSGERVDTNFEIPIYDDINQEVTKLYNVSEFPTIIYIKKSNEISNAKIGLASEDALIANLDILIENF